MGEIGTELIVADRWALYRGPLPTRGLHHHSTSALCAAGSEGIAALLPDGTTVSGRALAVPAGTRHELAAAPSERVSILVYEPRGRVDRDSARVTVPPDAEGLADWVAGASITDVEGRLDMLDGTSSPGRARDPRVVAAVRLLREDPTLSLPAREIAARVHLSPSRLSSLFVAGTGMSLRRYRLWVRLTSASRAVAGGAGLTAAAAAAGFADVAHFSASARRVLGISPSQVLGRGVRVISASEHPLE